MKYYSVTIQESALFHYLIQEENEEKAKERALKEHEEEEVPTEPDWCCPDTASIVSIEEEEYDPDDEEFLSVRVSSKKKGKIKEICHSKNVTLQDFINDLLDSAI